MTDVPVSNRIRLVFTSFEWWLSTLLTGRLSRVIGLPADAKVVRAIPCGDRMGRDVVIWLHSETFDPVPEGAIIPEMRLLLMDATPNCQTCDHAEWHKAQIVCRRGVGFCGPDDRGIFEPVMPLRFGCTLWTQQSSVPPSEERTPQPPRVTK